MGQLVIPGFRLRPADPSRETGGATSTWVGTRESDGARVLVVRDPVGCARDYARYLELVIDGMVPVADAFDLDMGVAVVYADPPRHRLAEVVDELGDLPRGQVLGILRHVCAVVGAMTSAGLPAPQLTLEHIGVGPDGSIWLCESAIGSAPDGATGRDLASAAAVSAREADVPTRDARGELESSAIAGLLSLAADLLPPDALAALGLDDVGAEWSGLGALIATLDQAHRAGASLTLDDVDAGLRSIGSPEPLAVPDGWDRPGMDELVRMMRARAGELDDAPARRGGRLRLSRARFAAPTGSPVPRGRGQTARSAAGHVAPDVAGSASAEAARLRDAVRVVLPPAGQAAPGPSAPGSVGSASAEAARLRDAVRVVLPPAGQAAAGPAPESRAGIGVDRSAGIPLPVEAGPARRSLTDGCASAGHAASSTVPGQRREPASTSGRGLPSRRSGRRPVGMIRRSRGGVRPRRSIAVGGVGRARSPLAGVAPAWEWLAQAPVRYLPVMGLALVLSALVFVRLAGGPKPMASGPATQPPAGTTTATSRTLPISAKPVPSSAGPSAATPLPTSRSAAVPTATTPSTTATAPSPGARPSAAGTPSKSQSSPTSSATAPTLADPLADLTGPLTNPVVVAQALADLRAEAWATLDLGIVRELNAPESEAFKADSAAVSKAAERGLRYTGLEFVVLKATARPAPGPDAERIVLDAEVDSSAFTIRGPDGRTTTTPGRDAALVHLELLWSGERWQVATTA
ncbi:hypothetical protein [Nostocoides vanveenii]|uniref:ARC6 IMS domain-containing protein n=1 Tax=Nostocoides vanveenii TaxID=330835 RepID=A0ABN2K5Z2_9MICO